MSNFHPDKKYDAISKSIFEAVNKIPELSQGFRDNTIDILRNVKDIDKMNKLLAIISLMIVTSPYYDHNPSYVIDEKMTIYANLLSIDIPRDRIKAKENILRYCHKLIPYISIVENA